MMAVNACKVQDFAHITWSTLRPRPFAKQTQAISTCKVQQFLVLSSIMRPHVHILLRVYVYNEQTTHALYFVG
jgi:hypothetical protein